MEVTFVPHLVPLDRGILESIYVSLRRGTTESQVAETLQHVRVGALRPFDRRRTSGDQARRAHQFLRHRLAR